MFVVKRAVNAGHYPVLDAIRSILAIVVVLGHLGLPPLFGSVDQADPVFRHLARVWRTFAFGPPAVFAFFVVSGFCIHLAFADPTIRLPVIRFYIRRYFRIVVPVLAIFCLLRLARPNVGLIGENSILWNSTLWSILCEEFYYAFYPIVLFLGRRFGMRRVFLGSIPPSLAVIAFNPFASEWTQIGIVGTSVVLAPIWLAGVLLAEEVWGGKVPLSSFVAIVVWRLGAFLTMWLSLILHFHSSLHQTASCLPVGVYAYFWLRAELSRAAFSNPPSLLVAMGAGSYSIYLVHPLVIDAFKGHIWLKGLSALSGWVTAMMLIVATSWIFYRLVEAPSHRLARKISLKAGTASAGGGIREADHAE